jgi:membrane protease YdiL (CAAX protease family)
VLYALIRAWGDSARGKIGGVALTSLLFAGLHLTNVFAYGVSLPAASFLTLETFVVSVWWGALVLLGGSIWPAVMLHFVVNAVVALQGLSRPMVEPDILAYSRVLWFSLPLGVLGIGLLLRAAPSLTLARATD